MCITSAGGRRRAARRGQGDAGDVEHVITVAQQRAAAHQRVHVPHPDPDKIILKGLAWGRLCRIVGSLQHEEHVPPAAPAPQAETRYLVFSHAVSNCGASTDSSNSRGKAPVFCLHEQTPDDVVASSAEQQVVQGKERQDAASVPSQDPAHSSIVSDHAIKSLALFVTGIILLSRALSSVASCSCRHHCVLNELQARGLVYADGGIAAG